jgi:hypothetical protein
MIENKILRDFGIPYKIEISDNLVGLLMRIAECRAFRGRNRKMGSSRSPSL